MLQRLGRVYVETSAEKYLEEFLYPYNKIMVSVISTKRQLPAPQTGVLGGDESSEGVLLQNLIEHRSLD